MATKKVKYRKLNDELDEILERLQGGELSIDEAVPAYERGMQLVKELEAYLQSAENRITEVQAKLQD